MSNLIHGRSHSRRFCCFKGCSSDLLTTRDGAISFFSFPIKDTERCSSWITNSGREEFRYLTPRELADKRICELHFQDSMFSNFFKTNLKKHAVPNSWENFDQEPIQIDDESSNECESGIVSEESSINNITCVNGLTAAIVVRESETILDSGNETILSTALLNGNSLSRNNGIFVTDSPPAEPSRDVEQSSAISTTLRSDQQSALDQIAKLIPSNKRNTKFHNLPPETTHTEFYFQQCSEPLEETNSMPEPPDGELPLFVQQNSVMSFADAGDQPHSDVNEPPIKRRRRDKDDDADMWDTVKHLRNITTMLTSQEDEFQLFGKSVALQLKKMNLCTAISVQAKIQHLLSEHRINDIQRETREKEAASKSSKKKSEETQDEEKRKNVSSGEEDNSPPSPQLSLTCASEHSDHDNTESK